MSARRRRFHEPSPVEFGVALLGISPREAALEYAESTTVDQQQELLGGGLHKSSFQASMEPQQDAASLASARTQSSTLHHPPSGDGGPPASALDHVPLQNSAYGLMNTAAGVGLPRRSSSFKNLMSAVVVSAPQNEEERGVDSTIIITTSPPQTTPPRTPQQRNTDVIVEQAPLSLTSSVGVHDEVPTIIYQQLEARHQPQRLPPLAHNHNKNNSSSNKNHHLPRRESPEPTFGMHNKHLEHVGRGGPHSVPRSDITFPSELCCPVCLDPFQTPVTLSCSHNVCHEHILDLAAAAAPGGVLPRGEGGAERQTLRIQCPKCREPTVFAQGMQSVHTNVEMKALVDMMVVMLSQQHHSSGGAGDSPPPQSSSRQLFRNGGRSTPTNPQTTAANEGSGDERTSPSPTSRPHVSSGRPMSRERGSGPKQRAVRFTEEIVLDEAAPSSSDASSRTPLVPHSVLKKPQVASSDNNNNNNSMGGPSSDVEGESSPSTAVASARKLEQQLRLQREKLREEREKQAKEKLEEFKRQRREDIEKRQEEAARSEALIAREGDLKSPPVAALGDGHGLPSARPSGGSAQQRRERVWEQQQRRPTQLRNGAGLDDEVEETVTSRQLHMWLAEGQETGTHRATLDPASVSPQRSSGATDDDATGEEDDVVSRHLRQLQLYEAGAPPATLLTASTKARKAEERIQHLFHPLEVRSREDRMREREQARLDRELELQRQYDESPDEEVEAKLWDVERRVLRQHDEELSRQQMAEIAEARARAQIAAFRKQSAGAGGACGGGRAPVAKASYIPKMHRLQKF
jgi:hypothetical protein